MIATLLINVGIPIVTLGIGWLAKKLHVESLIQQHEDVVSALQNQIKALGAQIDAREAITPVARK